MRKKTQHYPLIYARYIFPAIANLLIIVSLFIPNMRFTLDKDVRQSMSLFELIKNTWYNSRVYLFSAQTQQTSDGALFYKAVFVTLIVCGLLFLIGTAMTVFASVTALKYFKIGDKKAKNIYTAIVPNRFVMLLFALTLLPITFFPEMLVYLYKHFLLYPVSVSYGVVSAGILSLIVIVLLIITTLLSRKQEIACGLNIFNFNEEAKKSTPTDDVEPAYNNHTHYNIGTQKSNDEKLKSILGLSDDENEKSSEKS